MVLAEEISFFRFQDGTEKEIKKLTNEELKLALEYAESGMDILDRHMNRMEKKQDKLLKEGQTVPRSLKRKYKYKTKKNQMLSNLWEVLKTEGASRGVCEQLKATE